MKLVIKTSEKLFAVDNVASLQAYDKENSSLFNEAIDEVGDPEGITQVVVAEMDDGSRSTFYLYGADGDAWQMS